MNITHFNMNFQIWNILIKKKNVLPKQLYSFNVIIKSTL